MAKAQKSVRVAAAQAYANACAKILHLADWHITVECGDLAGNVWAEVFVTEMQNATITLVPSFFALSPERQRLVFAHEFAHMPLWRYDEVLRSAGRSSSREARMVLNDVATSASEYCAEFFGRLLASLLPLPRLS